MKMGRNRLSRFLRRSNELLEDLWPCLIQFPSGTPVQGSRVGSRNSSELADGGFVEAADAVIKVFKNVCPEVPRDGLLVKVRDTEDAVQNHHGDSEWRDYRIERVFGGLEPTWTMYLIDPSE